MTSVQQTSTPPAAGQAPPQTPRAPRPWTPHQTASTGASPGLPPPSGTHPACSNCRDDAQEQVLATDIWDRGNWHLHTQSRCSCIGHVENCSMVKCWSLFTWTGVRRIQQLPCQRLLLRHTVSGCGPALQLAGDRHRWLRSPADTAAPAERPATVSSRQILIEVLLRHQRQGNSAVKATVPATRSHCYITRALDGCTCQALLWSVAA